MGHATYKQNHCIKSKHHYDPPPAKKKSQHANVMLATINMYTVVDLTNKVTVVYLGKQILMSSVTTEKNVVEGQN